jgi:hypothetical protein
LRRAQACDPVQARDFEIVADSRRSDHAAIADQHHACDPEAGLHFVDLRFQRDRIRPVAIEHLDRNRQPLARAEQPVDDLRTVASVIPAVAVLRQRTMAALEVGRADVIKHQNAVLEMTAGQTALDPDLTLQEPIQRLIGLAILDLAEAQNRAQTRHGRLFIHCAHKAQLRPRRDQAIDHHRQHEIAVAPRRSVVRRAQNQAVQRDLTDHSQRRSNVAVR